MPHPPWRCVLRSAGQVLERSPARVGACPARVGRAAGLGLVVRAWPVQAPCGEPCSRHKRTAADRTLPWGTTMLVHHLGTDGQVEGNVMARGSSVEPRRRMDIHGKETPMTTTVCYKVIDLSPYDDDSPAHLEGVLNDQAEEGWELVTSFQRAHKALQVGSTTVQVPGLLSTVLVFKRAD